jgi:hypothetical protein
LWVVLLPRLKCTLIKGLIEEGESTKCRWVLVGPAWLISLIWTSVIWVS